MALPGLPGKVMQAAMELQLIQQAVEVVVLLLLA